MKLGPLEIRRSPRAAAATTARKPIGASGTVNTDGFLQQLEYLAALVGEPGIDAFEEMRSSDGSVAEALGHIVAPIRNAAVDVEPASDDLPDLEVAEATRRAYLDWPVQPFSEYVDQTLDYLVFGHQVFERVEHVIESSLDFEDPNGPLERDDRSGRSRAPRVEIPDRQWLTWRRFDQRLHKTITRWNADGAELLSIGQSTWKNGNFVEVTIPAELLAVFIHQRRGDDFTGRSLLRAAYKHFVMKDLLEKIEAIGLERNGVGVWIAYPPAGKADDQATLDRTEAILRDIRSGSSPYIVAPGPKLLGATGNQGGEGWIFEVVSPGSMPDFSPAINRHRGDIKGSILTRFSELGHGQTGARSTSDSQSEVWYDALHAVARHIAEVNQQQIRWFVDANFRGVTRYPKLVFQDIESKNLEEFANAHAKLVSTKAIEPDRSYRAFVRRASGAPPEDDPEKVEREQAEDREREQQAFDEQPVETE